MEKLLVYVLYDRMADRVDVPMMYRSEVDCVRSLFHRFKDVPMFVQDFDLLLIGEWLFNEMEFVKYSENKTVSIVKLLNRYSGVEEK